MKSVHSYELPAQLRKTQQKAEKLELITFIYLISVAIVMYLSLSSSQAMKSAWLEDVLSMIPSAGFLLASRINSKPADQEFPYGYHRIFSVTFLAGALGLLGMGLFLVYDSFLALLHAEHPTIGFVSVQGYQLWFGWIMIAALLYSAIPAMILGSKKLPLGKKLHNKLLFTDSKAQRADYLTAFAAIVGILLVGMGFWWADAMAALVISFSILKDGYKHSRQAVFDLMDSQPQQIDSAEPDQIIKDVERVASSWEWASAAKVRFREAGQIYFGQIAVVPKGEVNLDQLDAAYQQVEALHWKLHDLSIDLVKELPPW